MIAMGIICKLFGHNWFYYNIKEYSDFENEEFSKRKCIRCNRIEGNLHMETSIKYGEVIYWRQIKK